MPCKYCRFTFRIGENVKNVREVKADTYQQAAVVAARMMYGKTTCALRIYGMEDISGYFQAYRIISSDHKMQNLGKPFHVQKIYDTECKHGAYRMYDGLHYLNTERLKKY